MTKFYIYTCDKGYEFVEESSVEIFLKTETAMKYSGVAIEAEDLEEAIKIYNNPACGTGEYLLADDPSLAASLQNSYTNIQFTLELFKLHLQMKLVACKLLEISESLSTIADNMHDLYKNPSHMMPEVVFKALSSDVIEKTIKYNGKSKKTR